MTLPRSPGQSDTATSAAGGTAPDAARRLGRPSNERFRQLFTRNLNQLLDQRPDVPPEPAARAAELARVCAVTPAAARKWLTGAGWPTLEKLLDLAQRYGFAPDDLLADGPRQVVDLSRLVDAQALRRAELGELTPVPAFNGATGLRLALDPRAFGDTAGRAGATALALVTAPDDALLPDFATGDQVVVRLDPRWRGDGIYLLQLTSTSPALLRRVRQADGAFRIDTANADDAATPFAAFADDEAGSLDGSPILRGTPLCIVRAVHTQHE
jgi:transcriptional regulator with XRE-family HTH domain